MKKVCGFGLMCFSLGLFLSCFLSGFAIKFLLLLSGAVIGYLLFHDHFSWHFRPKARNTAAAGRTWKAWKKRESVRFPHNLTSVFLSYVIWQTSFPNGTENYARSTLPDLKQEVQTYIFLAPPFTFTLTDLMLDFHILLDLLWEWLTLIPKWAPLSQIAHLAMIAPPCVYT